MKNNKLSFIALILCLAITLTTLPFNRTISFAANEKHSLSSMQYMLDDNTGYNFSGKASSSKVFTNFAKYINVDMCGEGVKKTKYNNLTAFSIPYDNQKAYLEIKHTDSTWKTDTKLGSAKRKDGTTCDWKVSNDTYQFTSASDSIKHTVQNGLLVLEISDDGKIWTKHQMINFPAGKTSHEWTLSSDMLKQGKYIRLSFMFEAYTKWSTGWWIFSSSHTEYRNIIEVTETFYVAVDGFGEEDIAIATIKNLSNSNTVLENEEGFTKEEITFASTLTNNSLTTTGFRIECPFPNYKIEISTNDGPYKTVKSGHEVREEGKHTIKFTSVFGNTKTCTIFVQKSDLTKAYFNKPFSNFTENAFLQGKRVLSGTNSALEDMGISLDYEWASVPVYSIGATCNLNYFKSLIPLAGKIYGECPDGNITVDISNETAATIIVLNRAGYYTAILSTINTVGDKFTFTFKWWIVDVHPGSQINRQLLESKSQESYDLIPVYYAVTQEKGAFTYQENGKIIEKAGQMVYAFADYQRALDLALRIEKEYAIRDSVQTNMFRYAHSDNPNLLLTELELYHQMIQNAKKNVKVNYFSSNNDYTLRGLGNEIITNEGYCILFDGTNIPAPIVTVDLSERAALTKRSSIINNFSFISVSDIDSRNVTLKNIENNCEYAIAYDRPVGEQLTLVNAPSGVYEVCETNCYGIETRYEVRYLNEEESNDIELQIQMGENIENISANDNGRVYNVDRFSVLGASSILDSHALVLITKGRAQVPLDISNLSETKFVESGEYVISVEDRLGRTYEITVIVK